MRVYNIDEWMLRRAIESVLNQTESNLRFIIQDNGSTDGSNAIIREYADKDDRIVWYRNEVNCKTTKDEWNMRLATFNRGVHECDSKYFAFIDSDDYYEPTFLEKALKVANEEKADIVFVGYKQVDVDGIQISCKLPLKMGGNIQELPKDWLESNYPSFRTVWGTLYSTEYWDDYWKLIGAARNIIKNGIDTYMVLSLLMAANSIAFLPEAMYTQTVRKDSLYHTDSRVERILEAEVLALKTLELAQYAKILNANTLVFMASVYYYHIVDMVNVLIEKKEKEVLAKALNLLENGQVFKMFEDKNQDYKMLKANINRELYDE